MGFLAALPQVLASLGSIVSGNKAQDRARREGEMNRKLQLDTLQNQIQWRVADAKKAGIHPYIALGSNPATYSPVSTNFQGTDFGELGQDISRAVMAGQTDAQRRRNAGVATQAANEAAEERALALEHQALQNELLRSQIGRLNSAQVGPSLPASAEPGAVIREADRVTVGSVGAPARSPGEPTDYSFAPTADGGYTIVPSYDMKQRVEDMPSEWQWFLRNGIIPPRSVLRDLTRLHPPPPGTEYRFNPLTGEFRPRRRGFDPAAGSVWEFLPRR